MGTVLSTSLASLVAAAFIAAAAMPAAAQQNSRSAPRHSVAPRSVAPYDSNMSMIDRMARRNMDQRHIERRMRLAPPAAAPRRPGGGSRR